MVAISKNVGAASTYVRFPSKNEPAAQGGNVAARVRMILIGIDEDPLPSKTRALPWTRKGQRALDPRNLQRLLNIGF
jgi:hypothetical protein